MAREEAREQARNAGIIGTLRAMSGAWMTLITMALNQKRRLTIHSAANATSGNTEAATSSPSRMLSYLASSRKNR